MKQFKNNSELIERYWHFGCLSNELCKEGDYLLYKLEKFDVVLYYDGKEIVAFDNRCPHRGTHFFEAQTGSERAVCKYHGWSFTSGRIVIPMEAELRPDCPTPQLNRYRTEWCGTFLFFSIDPSVELEQQLGEELYSLIESLSFDCVSRKDLNQYIYECPWQVCIENALEPQHLPYVHKETLNKLDLINCRNHYWGPNSGVYFDIGNASLLRALKRICKYYDLGRDVHPGYMSLFLFPFGFISSTAGTSYSVQTFFPRTGGGTWFTSRLYSVRLSAPSYGAADSELLKAAIEMNRRVFEEDHEICKRISADAWEQSLLNPLYMSEEKILYFRKQILTISDPQLPHTT
jgi:phenylpropionate dioxygenase-like ring-hydroxylating dioxygenase large terminal subunit